MPKICINLFFYIKLIFSLKSNKMKKVNLNYKGSYVLTVRYMAMALALVGIVGALFLDNTEMMVIAILGAVIQLILGLAISSIAENGLINRTYWEIYWQERAKENPDSKIEIVRQK